jgi:predicted small lipoprotein YifL
LLKLAAVGALSAALLLAGCGRKAGLDPPPNAAVPATADGEPAPAAQPDGTTPPPKKRFILDWLID